MTFSLCCCISNLFIEGHWALDLGTTLIPSDLTFLKKFILKKLEINRKLQRQKVDVWCALHLFPPVVTSYIIPAQYQTQQCDIATMCMYHAMSFNHMSESETVSHSVVPDSLRPHGL